MAGRKNKPTALKKFEGNPGKRPLNDQEPQPDRTPPTCPAWLLPEAKREWRRVVPELERLGLITLVDRAALAGYCQAYAQWRRAEEALKEGLTYEYLGQNFKAKIELRPEAAVAQKYLSQVRAFCAEFGLTPSARGRMSVPGQPAEQDPLDKMLGTVKN
jgi:P27 family predicted phage terminase small subunit